MGDDKGMLWGELKNALEEWGAGRGRDMVTAVTQVVWVNWERGRACSFLNGGKVNGPQAYVERVGKRYQALSSFLRQLQVEKDAETWTEAIETFQLWSYNLLGRLNWRSNRTRYQLSVDLATDAAAEMVNAHFPYDVDFAPWAYVFVRNVCYRYMRDRLNGSRVPEEQLVNLEAWDGWLRNLADERAEARIHEAAEKEAWERRRELLLAAVEALPPSEKKVILLYYFEDLPFDEISERTGKKPNALYQYHFRALGRLRDSLEGQLAPT